LSVAGRVAAVTFGSHGSTRSAAGKQATPTCIVGQRREMVSNSCTKIYGAQALSAATVL
jgi:hypothetical protein